MSFTNYKMLFPVFFLVFISISNGEENKASIQSVSPVNKTAVSQTVAPLNDTLTVTARLIEVPGTMPPNDIYNYVYIMKYKILSVIKGKYREKEIYVGHYNPLIPRKMIKGKMDAYVNGNIDKFVVGSKHQLTLIAPIEKIWKDAVEDEYIEIELDKFFALVTDEIK